MLRMSDIAAKAGVSQSTVSFVLNGRHTAIRISEETRQKVLDAAEELGYRNNRIARAVRTGNTRMLGIVGGLLSNEHVGAMIAGAIIEANNANYTIKPLPELDENQNPRDIVRWSSEWRLSGVIALHMPHELVAAMHAESQHYGYPMVLLDTRSSVENVPQIVSDDAGGIQAAIAHLMALGHHKIAYISGEEISTLSPLRIAYFREAMQKQALEIPENFVTNGNYGFVSPNEKVAHDLLTLPRSERPTAILCGGDRIAAVVIQTANRLGVSIPRDLSLIGTANLSVAELLSPPLTTIAQPFREMGRAAARCLIEIVEQNSEDKKSESIAVPRPNALQLLDTELIIRESTAKAQ